MKARGYFTKSPVLFPNELLNTAISGERLSITKDFRYADGLLNMTPSIGQAGVGSKRFGTKEYISTPTGAGNIIKMFKIRPDNEDLELLVYTDTGVILRWRNDAWESLKTGLSATTTPDFVAYNEKIIIYNGLDQNMIYDGDAISLMEELVEDQIQNGALSAIGDEFQVAFTTLFPDKYENGVILKVKTSNASDEETTTDVTISSVNKSTNPDDDTLTDITFLSGDFVLPADSVNLLEIKYTDNPPAFKHMFVQYFRLWGLAGENMIAYYTEFTNNENGWFNEATQSVPFINMENNYPINDDLQAIRAINGQMLFMGKRHTQIWTGSIPGDNGDFSFAKSIPTGTVDGRLVQPFPQSLVTTTEYGIRDFSTTAITDNLEISPDIGTNIDPTIQQAVSEVLNNDVYLAEARSFVYTRDGIYGFKLADKVLIYVLSDKTKGWTEFSGDFLTSKDFMEFDTQLLLTFEDKVLVYTNGAKDSGTAYADRGEPIRTLWRTPFLEPKQRFSNIYIELLLERNLPSSIVTVRRYMDNNLSNFKSRDVEINTQQGRWDIDFWDTTRWDFSQENRTLIRDKFIANAAAFEIDTNHTEAFAIAGFNLLGGS